ncbi:hypothetical protein HER10_EVM0010942 [Colletotrichum scovillei]|uniref:uncharacterized protein n=1 Tax=Colletotrichum scovillei TaxID=1209932 RepID=UPI0015C3CAE7|nr:uncharacterized protein HER10_EVM0010942 [Colletotrichum scovillei]KAF4780304.1 hypothetical protein HER10_EVM0010942 [Colletotrichum scovillei]
MDPLTAIGLVANILAFVDFGLKGLREAKSIYKSSSGLTGEAASLQKFAEQTRHFADNLQTPDPMGLDDDEKVLCALAKDCCKICQDILTLIDGIRSKKAFSGIHAIKSVLKGVKYQSDLKSLQAKLNSCQSQIGPQLTYITRLNSKRIISKLNIMTGNAEDNFARLQEIKGSIESLKISTDVCSLRDSIKDDIQKLVRIPERSLERLAQGSILRGLEFDTMYCRHDAICEAHEKTFRWILADYFDDRCNVNCPNGRQYELLSNSGAGVMKDMNLKVDVTSALAEENALTIWTEGDGGHFSSLARDISHGPDQLQSSQCLPICEERRGIRQKFTQWLSSGSGVFHFSAKLGAGKSTLMKMIINHDESRKRLDTWAVRTTVFAFSSTA